jgi:hypothetical protein
MGRGTNAVKGSCGENGILACDIRTGGSNVHSDEAGKEQLTEKRSGEFPAVDMRQRVRQHLRRYWHSTGYEEESWRRCRLDLRLAVA